MGLAITSTSLDFLGDLTSQYVSSLLGTGVACERGSVILSYDHLHGDDHGDDDEISEFNIPEGVPLILSTLGLLPHLL